MKKHCIYLVSQKAIKGQKQKRSRKSNQTIKNRILDHIEKKSQILMNSLVSRKAGISE